MLSHPMDEAHARIDAENQLILRLNDAMSFRKVKEMREMLVEYRRLDPADADANQAGYAVIADASSTPARLPSRRRASFTNAKALAAPALRRRICFESSN